MKRHKRLAELIMLLYFILQKDRQLLRRRIRLHKILDGLDVEVETVNNDVSNVTKTNYTQHDIRRVFGHGANLVFQRMFILTNAEKGLHMTSVDREGKLCDLIYVGRYSFDKLIFSRSIWAKRPCNWAMNRHRCSGYT